MSDPAVDAVREIRSGRWGLSRARTLAREVERSGRGVRALLAVMFGEDALTRKRAADVARRVTERSAEPLWRHAEELAGLLAEVPAAESRTRWHLGLVVARVAHTREQRLRAARMMELLMQDDSNVVRCSGVEGICLLASEEPTLRDVAGEIVETALRSGTPAERCRAREGKKRLERAASVQRDR